MLLALTSSMAFAVECPINDQGYAWSVGNIQFNRLDGSNAYCRVVGNPGNWWIRCTIQKSDNTCTETNSKVWSDMGYLGTEYWADSRVNGQMDFCRLVGNPPNRFKRCILGPNFDTEQ
jgi:hypothetical protein